MVAGPCARKKELQRKMTNDSDWICAKVCETILIALFTCLCLKEKLGLCSINCHIHAMTRSCSASLRVLANSLRVIYAIIGNPPLGGVVYEAISESKN